jgi:hypothetical protein
VKRRQGQPATVNLSMDLRTLEIVGDETSLTLLAENLSDLGAQSRPGEHWHLEYFPDHFYLGATSQPLVATLTDPAVRRDDGTKRGPSDDGEQRGGQIRAR